LKKFILLLSFIVAAFSVLAQDYERSYDHHDIAISYNLMHQDQLQNFDSDMLNERYPHRRYVRDEYSSPGGIFVTYRHMLRNETMFFGVTAGFSSSTCKIYNVGQYEGELKRQFITLAVEWEYRYVNQCIVQVYSGFGLGYTYGTEELTPPSELGTEPASGDVSNVAYQLNVVGVRIGKKFAGFAEFGYGYKGIVNIGFSIQLF